MHYLVVFFVAASGAQVILNYGGSGWLVALWVAFCGVLGYISDPDVFRR